VYTAIFIGPPMAVILQGILGRNLLLFPRRLVLRIFLHQLQRLFLSLL